MRQQKKLQRLPENTNDYPVFLTQALAARALRKHNDSGL
jgi:hypothetical protein